MRKITDEDIYRYYLGDFIIGAMYNSPIPGRNDKTPSFQVYEHRKTGRLCWIDYGLPNQFGSNAYNLVQYLRNIPITDSGYGYAKRIAYNEVSSGMIGKPTTVLKRLPTKETTPYINSNSSFKEYEIKFWERFGISEQLLKDEGVESVSSMSWFGKKGDVHIKSTETNPAFVYWWNKNPASWKLYQPFKPKREKFRQENVSGIIEGWNSMIREYVSGVKFKVLFINSSTKDRLTVKAAYGDTTKYNGINPRGEKDRQDLLAKKEDIDNLAERVCILYDADDPGYESSMILQKLTGWEAYDMRGKLDGQKDFSDYKDTEKGNYSQKDLVNIINKTILL